MTGFPPPGSDSLVTLDNWQTPPFNRWAFQHMREIIPSQAIRRGAGPVSGLESAEPPVDLDDLGVARSDGGTGTLRDVLEETYTDSVIVLHDGRLVMERYFSGMKPCTPHLLMSVSKSLAGCVTGILGSRGLLDPGEQVSHYVPEIVGSGYDGATVRNLLEMRTGVRFSEEYTDPNAEVRVMERHMGWRPPDNRPLGLYAFLATLESAGEHGKAFEYHSGDTDMLGWVCERAAGSRMADLMSDLLWQPLGAEYDAEITCDAVGSAVADGGISTTTRDLARFGQMLLQDGRVGEVTVVPEEWLRGSRAIDSDIRAAFSSSASEPFLPGGWYRNQFWFVPGPSGDLLLCLGIHGQMVLVDHSTNMVAVKFSTWPDAQNPSYLLDTIQAFTAAGRHLAGLPPVTTAPQDRRGGPLVDAS